MLRASLDSIDDLNNNTMVATTKLIAIDNSTRASMFLVSDLSSVEILSKCSSVKHTWRQTIEVERS